jgi:hypothetical protein
MAPHVRVLCLHGSRKESKFSSNFLVPLRELIDTSVLSETQSLGLAARDVIRDMIDEIGRLFP